MKKKNIFFSLVISLVLSWSMAEAAPVPPEAPSAVLDIDETDTTATL